MPLRPTPQPCKSRPPSRPRAFRAEMNFWNEGTDQKYVPRTLSGPLRRIEYPISAVPSVVPITSGGHRLRSAS
jgi:hypothetical protein